MPDAMTQRIERLVGPLSDGELASLFERRSPILSLMQRDDPKGLQRLHALARERGVDVSPLSDVMGLGYRRHRKYRGQPVNKNRGVPRKVRNA